MTRALWLAALAAAAYGCAKSAAQLEPFPCAQDGTCGGGLTCVPPIGCIELVLCDPTDQSTCDAPLPKCSTIFLTEQLQPACVPANGSVADGQPCTLTAFGEDDCAPGLVCTSQDTLPNQPVCRRFCGAPGDCGATESCVYLLTVPNVASYGICATSCDLFGAQCGAGETCTVDLGVDLASWAPHCRGAGDAGVGATCFSGDDCGANALCQSPDGGNTAVCQALCDGAHACAGGTACTVLQPAIGADAGYCP